MCKNSGKDEISVQCQLRQISTSIFFCWTLFSSFGKQFCWNGKGTSLSSQVDKKISISLPFQPKGKVA
jgi:hypothetical protein